MQGRYAAQEMTGQPSLAGEAGDAFALAVDEAGAAFALAVGEAEAASALTQGEAGTELALFFGGEAVQDGAEGTMDYLTDGEPEGKETDKQYDGMSPSSISMLLLQGAYHIQQAVDMKVPIEQVPSVEEKAVPSQNDSIPKGIMQESGRVGSIVPKLHPERMLMPLKNDLVSLSDTHRKNGSDSQIAAVPRTISAETGIPMPESTMSAVKGMDELDQAGFRIVQKLQELGTVKEAQPLGADTAREELKLSPGDAGVRANAAIKPEGNSKKAGGNREKSVQAPLSALVMAHGTEKALRLESMQSSPDMTPENTVREENAAMQVARASVRALKRGATEYRIRLSPEGLGEVEVTVVTKGKAVSLSMRTENETARGLILGHADELRAELGQQNYQIDGLSVEVGMDNGNGAGFYAPREHAGTAREQRHPASEQGTPSDQAAAEQQMKKWHPMPRSGTINYRI